MRTRKGGGRSGDRRDGDSDTTTRQQTPHGGDHAPVRASSPLAPRRGGVSKARNAKRGTTASTGDDGRKGKAKERACERKIVASSFGATCRLSTVPSHRDMAYVAYDLLYAEGAEEATTARRRATAAELSYYLCLAPTYLVELTFAVAFEGVATTGDRVAAQAARTLSALGHFTHSDAPSIAVTAFPLSRAEQALRARAVMDKRLNDSRVSALLPLSGGGGHREPLPRIRCCRPPPPSMSTTTASTDDTAGGEQQRQQYALAFPTERAFMTYFCPMRPEDWDPPSMMTMATTTGGDDDTPLLLLQQEQQLRQQQQEEEKMPPALRTIRRHPDPAARDKVQAMLDESAGIPFKCPSLAKVQRWLDTVARLPLGTYSPPLEPTRRDLDRVRADLDAVAHGMLAAKTAALEMAAKLQLAPSAPMRALLLEGPPGCGKTTFAMRALGRALRRPVRVINLGGVKDSTVLLGHNYTYEGSRPGRVVEELCAARVSDPVLVFDEVDKVSDTPGGREIEHVLMALIDPVQNAEFVDNYLYGVPLDLSRALLVFTCNDVSAISAPLLDRLRVVTFAQPSAEQKRAATRDHVIPRVAGAMGLLLTRGGGGGGAAGEGEETRLPLLFPPSVKDRDAIVDRLVDFCSGGSSDNANEASGKGMRGIEKAVERVLMNGSVRRVMMRTEQPPPSSLLFPPPPPPPPLITCADVDSTLAIMRREQRDSEQARRSAAYGDVDACVRHSMYT